MFVCVRACVRACVRTCVHAYHRTLSRLINKQSLHDCCSTAGNLTYSNISTLVFFRFSLSALITGVGVQQIPFSPKQTNVVLKR